MELTALPSATHPLQAYASYVDVVTPDVLLAALKAGATEKFNGDLSNNWERLQCSPKDGWPRQVCKNQYSNDYAIVFDADCGAAGLATIEVRPGGRATAGAVQQHGPCIGGWQPAAA